MKKLYSSANGKLAAQHLCVLVFSIVGYIINEARGLRSAGEGQAASVVELHPVVL